MRPRPASQQSSPMRSRPNAEGSLAKAPAATAPGQRVAPNEAPRCSAPDELAQSEQKVDSATCAAPGDAGALSAELEAVREAEVVTGVSASAPSKPPLPA